MRCICDGQTPCQRLPEAARYSAVFRVPHFLRGGRPRKGQPQVYEEAARRFGAQPGEIAVYEDALFAARTARQAGFYVVGVYDRGSKDFDQLKQMADEVVLSWRDCLG